MNNRRLWILIGVIILSITGCIILKNNGNSKNIIIDNDSVRIENKNMTNTNKEESIKIPGFKSETLDNNNQELYLTNPQDNSVYIKYDIKERNKTIYETDYIEPGLMVKANIYDSLSQGIHDIDINLFTRDIITGENCNGAKMKIKVEVK